MWLIFKTEIVLLRFLVSTKCSMYVVFWKIGHRWHVQQDEHFIQCCSHIYGHFNGICEMTMTLGPRSIMEMGTSVVLGVFFKKKKLFWGRREAGSYVYMISLRVVWTLLLVMRYAQDKCLRAIGFLLCTLGLEVFYRKQGVCNNIRYRNLKRFHGTHFYSGRFTVF